MELSGAPIQLSSFMPLGPWNGTTLSLMVGGIVESLTATFVEVPEWQHQQKLVPSSMLRGCRGAGCQDSVFQSRIQVLLTCCCLVLDATTLRVGEAGGLLLPRDFCTTCNFENSVIWILLHQ